MRGSTRAAWRGHLWTVGVRLARGLWPPRPPASAPWGVTVDDPRLGPIGLTGGLSPAAAAGDGGAPPARALLVVVHGLGGCADSHYAVRAAARATAAGLDCLRLNLRGADRRGEDFYHAGLTDDLHAALADPGLAAYETIQVLGFSLGGHMALAWACEPGDARVRSVAAICAPLDLDGCARAIDARGRSVYRSYVLRPLKEIYRAVAARRPVPTPTAVTDRLRTIRAWDERTVAPRFGFAGAADYYARASAGPRLGRLRVRSLLVAATHDPLVPAATLRPFVDPPPPALEVRWVGRGGHVAFPGALDLGFDGERGLVRQVLAWAGGGV